MDKTLASLREERQKLVTHLDESPDDETATGKLNTINQAIRDILAKKKKGENILPTLQQLELDMLAERKLLTKDLQMVKLKVKYWAIQLVTLYPNVYPVSPMSGAPMIFDTPGAAMKVLCSDTEYMVPKEVADDLVTAYPHDFKL